MAYRVIDDDTALKIYEAVQQHTSRNFSKYNRMRQLPRITIAGEMVFYLDELLEFASKEMNKQPSDTLEEVLDAGIVSWYGNLNSRLLKKLKLKLDDCGQETQANTASEEYTLENQEAIDALKKLNKELTTRVDALSSENAKLTRELERLRLENEELLNQNANNEEQPAYLNARDAQSGYTQLTTHLLQTKQDNKNGGRKQTGKKKRRKS